MAKSNAASQQFKADPPIVSFDGALTSTPLPPTSPLIPKSRRNRTLAFAFEVTFDLGHPHLIALSAQRPPRHFHPYQEEYIQVLEGWIGVDVEGVGDRIIRPEDGEVVVKPWMYHGIYPVLDDGRGNKEGEDKGKKGRFLLSAEQAGETLKLDTIFFQNWYGYQDDIVVRGGKMDLIQVMCMFDAGASYLALPTWIPLGKHLSRASGIVLGRWIGGLLGYQPFYRKWTTDWELACRKMETSWLQRRFADRKAKVE